MNPINTIAFRSYQKALYLLSKLIRFPIPEVFHNLNDILEILKKEGKAKPILIAGKTISKKEEVISLLRLLQGNNLSPFLYNKVSSDPDRRSIDDLATFYRSNGCDCIIAIGGGSSMDAGKALAVRLLYPKKPLEKFAGILKVRKKTPLLIACATTAGTGSEATVCSVITQEEEDYKFAISDPVLTPRYAILDSRFLKSLPRKVIADCGMDALCHALEAYLSCSCTPLTRKYSLTALKLIHENLAPFYLDSSNQRAGKSMLEASFDAGVSFTRAYVGYVHALAHAIGGKYHIAHGRCIAILLPYVLRAYGKKAERRLSEVYDVFYPDKKDVSMESKAALLISEIEDMNQRMDIPSSFQGQLKEEDFDSLSKRAYKEANPLYPVPRLLNQKELKNILIQANHA